MIEELSKYLDLSNTEAKVYLTLLKHGYNWNYFQRHQIQNQHNILCFRKITQ